MASNASPFLDRLTKITSCWGNFPSALIMFLRSLIWTIWDLKSREPEKISFRSIEVGNLKFVGNFYFVFGWSWNILHFVLSKRTYTVLGLSFRAEKLNEEDETHVDNLFCSIFGILGDSLVIPHQKNCHLLKKKKNLIKLLILALVLKVWRKLFPFFWQVISTLDCWQQKRLAIQHHEVSF